jgi:diaminobutyrate-2-oxoglutarate transaminase
MRHNSVFLPYDGYLGPNINTIDHLYSFLKSQNSEANFPAAVIVETVQGEGGIHVASNEWLRMLEQACREFDILLIVDDIQMGNGRTGTFFSFERANIRPDMVILSKAIGGGMPMALLLLNPELDQWQTGEHTGTFRGNNLAFVAATQALRYWNNNNLANNIKHKSNIMETELKKIAGKYKEVIADVRGIGMVWGMESHIPEFSSQVSLRAFEKGLMIEISGSQANVIKFLPALTIEETTLREGLRILDESIESLLVNKITTS